MRDFKLLILGALIIGIPMMTSCIRDEDDLSSQNCPGACTIIKGRFTTANQQEGLSNIPLEVLWENSTSTGLGKSGTFRRKATGTTDMNGNYELKFLMRDDELAEGYFHVNFKADPKKYYFHEESGFSLDLKRDTTVIYNYLIPRKAFIELQIANREAIKNSDYFSSSFYFDIGVMEPTINSLMFSEVVNLANSSQRMIGVAGDQPIIIETSKQKDNIKTVQSDTIFIPSGQTYTFRTEF